MVAPLFGPLPKGERAKGEKWQEAAQSAYSLYLTGRIVQAVAGRCQ